MTRSRSSILRALAALAPFQDSMVISAESGEEKDLRFKRVTAAPVSTRSWTCRLPTVAFTMGNCRQLSNGISWAWAAFPIGTKTKRNIRAAYGLVKRPLIPNPPQAFCETARVIKSLLANDHIRLSARVPLQIGEQTLGAGELPLAGGAV